MYKLTPIPGTYDYRLVALSIVIAICASYVALDLTGRVTANRGRARLAWLLGSGFAMGSGIWSMHYIGMLAYRLPVPVYYHIPTVALSLLAAVLASLIALFVVSRDQVTPLGAGIGSLLMGAGIATMHFTGMAAMRLPAMHHYRGGLELLAVFFAVVISAIGLRLISHFRDESHSWKIKGLSALLMGLAIPVIHYTGMAAVIFMPTVLPPDLTHSVDMSALATSAIVVVTFVVLGIVVITALIDRRLSAKQAILEDAEVFINAVPSILIGMDQDSRITRWNLTAARVFGLTRAEVAGKPLADCGIRWLQPGMDDEIRSWCSERICRRSDSVPFAMKGATRLLGLTITAVRMNDSNSVELLVIGSDVTEREKVGAALREAEREYRGIFDNAIFGIFRSTPAGRYLSVNPAMARILGYDSPEEMIATLSDISLQMYIDPKRRDEFVLIMNKLGVIQNFECEVFRKDGSRIWIVSSARAVREKGVVVRYEGMTEDITESKLLRSQLLQAQKLESVGQLAAGIAHEINTPTQYIGDNVRFLKDAFQDLTGLLTNYERLLAAAKANTLSRDTVQEVSAAVERADAGYLLAEIPKAIAQTVEGITRVSKLVSAMKEFSHPGTKEKIPLDLNHAINSTITVARNEWKYVADLETEFDPSLPLISCLPGEFNQVILNLIVNAAHAIADVTGKEGSEKGRIKVQTRNCPEWVEIRIQDTGSGIPKNARARVFDPFFTTKEIGKGTGQGLAIAHSVVVDKHGGTIHFETEEGKGTTFIIRLPHDGKALAASASS
jgi:PAS domain S-box-containing protein